MKKLFTLLFTIMLFAMNAQVTVGNVIFEHITKCEIKQSVKEFTDVAEVTIPRNFTLKNKNVLDYIKVEDKSEIKLGINGVLYTEFTGYVTEISSDIPLRISFEDEMYKLKKGVLNKSWKSVKLKEILMFIAPDYKIKAPDVDLGSFGISNDTPYFVLKELRKQYGFSSYIKKDTLYCGFAYDIRNEAKFNHVYEFYKDIPSGGNKLKFQKKDDFEIIIRAISNNRDGSKTKIEIGHKDSENASLRTLNFSEKTETKLNELALKEFERLNFDGYRGSITGLGHKKTKAGDSLTINDSKDTGKNGTYLIESVNIKWENSLFWRENSLSYKI